jgi:polyhydroxyalkanoate synthesis regulator protein
MWSPFTGLPGAKRSEPTDAKGEKAPAKKESDELSELKAQLANMQQKIDKLSQDRD